MKANRLVYAVWLPAAAALYFFENNTGTRAICTHGEAAQAENVPNISAVNRNGQQTAMRDPQRQGYAGDGPGTGFFARQRIAQMKRSVRLAKDERRGGQTAGKRRAFFAAGGRVER